MQLVRAALKPLPYKAFKKQTVHENLLEDTYYEVVKSRNRIFSMLLNLQ